MIEDLQLQDKRDVPSSDLSGGMKRKLRQDLFMISDRSKPTYRGRLNSTVFRMK